MKTEYRLSRGQAIDVGLLVDVSSVARSLGIKPAVAVSEAVYRAYIARPPHSQQTEKEALRDFLWLFTLAYEHNPVFCIRSLQIPWCDEKLNPRYVGFSAYQEQNAEGICEITLVLDAQDRLPRLVSIERPNGEITKASAFADAEQQRKQAAF